MSDLDRHDEPLLLVGVHGSFHRSEMTVIKKDSFDIVIWEHDIYK